MDTWPFGWIAGFVLTFNIAVLKQQVFALDIWLFWKDKWLCWMDDGFVGVMYGFAGWIDGFVRYRSSYRVRQLAVLDEYNMLTLL